MPSFARLHLVPALLATSCVMAFTACGSGSAGPPTGGDAVTWVNRTAGTSAAELPWLHVASDSTGTKLVALNAANGVTPQGDIWTSTDGGVTWTNRTAGTEASGQHWSTVASDASGARLVAVNLQENGLGPAVDVWTSADSGATWINRTTVTSTSPYLLGPAVTSDSTG